jgi:hypothetical protein
VYDLDAPLDKAFNVSHEESYLPGLSTTSFTVEGSVSVQNEVDFQQIQDLIVRNIYVQYKFVGQITVKISTFYTSVHVERTQQYKIK